MAGSYVLDQVTVNGRKIHVLTHANLMEMRVSVDGLTLDCVMIHGPIPGSMPRTELAKHPIEVRVELPFTVAEQLQKFLNENIPKILEQRRGPALSVSSDLVAALTEPSA